MKISKRFLAMLLCLCMLIPMGMTWVSAEEQGQPKASDENVALGKPVEATSGSGESSVTDGNIGSYWDSTGGHESGTPSDVVVDLKGWYDLEKINVITYHGDGRYYQFEVSVSANGADYISVGKKDDTAAATAEGTAFAVDTEESIRYIKVTMTKNSKNPEYHISELQAYGTLNPDYEPPAITTDPADPKNVAVGKPTRSNYNTDNSFRVTDANTTSAWSGNAYPQYVDVDLLANYDISEIIVYMPTSEAYTYTVYGSLDGVNFTRIADSNVKKLGNKEGDVFTFEEALNYRVIRVNVTSAKRGGKASVCEIKVHGTVNNNPVTPTRDEIKFTSYDEWLLKNHDVDTSKLKDANGNYDIEDTYTEKDTIEALNGLVSRILGDKYVDWFEFDVAENTKNDYDYFEISNGSGKIKIKGNDGVAIASGLNHYLKYYCNVNVSQQTKQVAMPTAIPAVEKTIRKETVCEVRYAFNYCTLSYTMQFYGYTEWQRELDYLMLSGVNVILDTTASEALWVSYLVQYGYTVQEAIDFVCGYAFKAWWLMGNLENYGGSVGDQWMYDTLEMARVNQRYMTVMGCMPCLNIFAGTLPTNFAQKADKALTEMGYANVGDYYTSTGGWCGFTRPYALNTTFPGFEKMTIDFYETQNHLYGQVTDFYAGDFLHEISAGFQLDPSFNKANMSRTVLDYLIDENEDARWIMQSWWENPLPEVVAGFGDDREDHVLMLDLAAANDPRWKNTTRHGGPEFGNSSWIYCMLDNYGGRTGMHGAFAHITRGLLDAYRNAKHFKGIGITPEGTEENPASYDFFWELMWLSVDDVPAGVTDFVYSGQYVKEWISNYAKRRYGTESDNIQTVWEILAESVYGTKTVDGTSTNGIITCEPRIFESGTSGGVAFGVGSNGGYYRVPYAERKLEEALKYMVMDFTALKDKETYVYDLCDMLCQALTNTSTVYFHKMGTAINAGNYEEYIAYKNGFLRCFILIDEVTSYVDDTMLGNWVGRIDDWVNDKRTGEYADYDIDTMKHNALILPTVWGSQASLVGYANREYAGLMKDYYYRMWKDLLYKTDVYVENGMKRSAETNRAWDFQCAWDLIVARGEGLSREVLPAGGDKDKDIRSLKEIYAEFVQTLKADGKPTAMMLEKKSGEFTFKNTSITKLKAGTTAEALVESFVMPKGAKIVITDAAGSVIANEAPVREGYTVTLLNSFGAEQDYAVVGTMESGLVVENSKIRVGVGDTAQIVAKYEANGGAELEITYKSANEEIATVDKDGKVTGVAEGTVLITVTAGEDSKNVTVTVAKASEGDDDDEGKVPGGDVIDDEDDKGNPTDDNKTDKDDSSALVFIIIGVVAAVAVCAAVLFIVMKKKK